MFSLSSTLDFLKSTTIPLSTGSQLIKPHSKFQYHMNHSMFWVSKGFFFVQIIFKQLDPLKSTILTFLLCLLSFNWLTPTPSSSVKEIRSWIKKFLLGISSATLDIKKLISLSYQSLPNTVYAHLLANFMHRFVAERISNHYLVRELFWPLEFRLMRMTVAILPGSPPRAT